MIPLYSSQQVREVDNFAINELGIPGLVLMENAAIGIYNHIIDTFPKINHDHKFGIICGRGNNGGDGFALARILIFKGFDVKVLLIADEKELSSDAHLNFRILKNVIKEGYKSKIVSYKSPKDIKVLNDCSVIVDAILGTGAKGALRSPLDSLIPKLNDLDAIRIAIDIPTGLDADEGYGEIIFDADLTVTLAEYKKGLFFGSGYKYCGEIKKGNIGVDEKYFVNQLISEYLIEPEDVYYNLPVKELDSQKYSAGKVLTIAGSGKYPGAAAFTANSILKSGAGASVLAFPKSIKSLAQAKLDASIVHIYDDKGTECLSAENILELRDTIEWADVIAIGPGLGRNIQTKNAVRTVLDEFSNKKIIIDADAINALNQVVDKVSLKNQILTPHHKEFADLIGISVQDLTRNILSYGKQFVKETGAYLVLKGAPTMIFNPDGEVFINSTGNPGMSKFGVGDVLTGVISGFLAQSDEIEPILISAVYLHSLSADLLLEELSEYGITATDIQNNLPKAIQFIRKTFEEHL